MSTDLYQQLLATTTGLLLLTAVLQVWGRSTVRAIGLLVILLLGIALLIWRGAKRGLIISLWVLGVVAMLGLFRYHVTSVLDLSF